MTLISKNKLKLLMAIALYAVAFSPFGVLAQESQSISVSPTLFEMTANPSQKWDSGLRVINSNPYELTVYIDIVNFAPQGESGQGKFIPINPEEANNATLAEWISLDKEEITIPPEQTAEIPLHITLPEDAPPGGHFAAILVGTKSPENSSGSSQVETAQVVTSLVFLRVTGDIVESGSIREFRSTKILTEKPQMDFELRFQNKGNVHILPQGEIKILNMWGQERGIIPVNRHMLFGNVLPDQIRKYNFSWEGEWSIADMGRYTAAVTLGYGENQKQFVTSETFFWVIPWKLALLVLVVLFAFVFLTTLAIRMYVRKVLQLAGVNADGGYVPNYPKQHNMKRVSVTAPIEEGILDLRLRFAKSNSLSEKADKLVEFIKQYKIFFGSVLLIVSFIVIVFIYVKNASISERGYEVTVNNGQSEIKISSEEVEYQSIKSENTELADPVTIKDFPPIKIVNSSGINGLAAKLRVDLEAKGFVVSEISSDLAGVSANTVIVYGPEFASEALQLSSEVDNTLLSSFADAPEDQPLVIYLGSDFQNNVE